MPDKPLTVLTYAASASLAAIALIYFFNPNHLIDADTTTSASSRKKGIVGLANPANDCFINSVLQSLAGLGDLRLYLIRELHRRKLDGEAVYASLPLEDGNGKPINAKKLKSLQSGEVTQGLKDIIDGLNERPIYRKTVSAGGFIAVLEHAFGTRISKAQQDAQELLQIVAERLCDEYHAGKAARKRARLALDTTEQAGPEGLGMSLAAQASPSLLVEESDPKDNPGAVDRSAEDDETGFPLEGQTESQIECQHCHFVPKSKPTSFVMLTLSVPQQSSATLNECFDGHFKTEFIDDYKCDRCRLVHAVEMLTKDLAKATSESAKTEIEESIRKVQAAIDTDPEQPPKDVKLPDSKLAPARRIGRHVKVTRFPKILVIHLSRSIFDPRSSSAKNTAKVSFPEKLPLGGLLNRRNYKLLGVVTHKGTHNSGHYESFRRQHVYPPTSTPHSRPLSGPYSASPSPNPSAISSPSIQPRSVPQFDTVDPAPLNPNDGGDSLSSAAGSSPSLVSDYPSASSTRPSTGSQNSGSGTKRDSLASSATTAQFLTLKSTSDAQSLRESTMAQKSLGLVDSARLRRKKKSTDRWWRISDEKIKECKTSDVLGMQKEVYMLFYEMERD